MKKIFACLTFLLLVCFGIGVPQAAHADFPERPVGFVVIDKSGAVDGAVYKEWRTVVKWAYHFPDYKIVDSGEPQKIVGNVLKKNVKVTKELLSALAEESQVDVLVVTKVYSMSGDIVSGGFGSPFDDDGPYVLVDLDADLYVYKKDGDKFLKKRLRERELKDLGNYERPQETVKWKLANLVNKMEGRPQI
ncbi:MAG: hypothetical protein IJX10_02445 [Phascolarctobacterium sp.]|nr:hypothetical protein [Phascolarctobacterium sp.]